jgi:hypothetical protein
VDENGAIERVVDSSSETADEEKGIGRSRFLAAAGGTMFGIVAGTIVGVEPAAALVKYPGGIDKELSAGEVSDAITAIETELGTDPSGTATTVKEALEAKQPLGVFSLTAFGAVGDGVADDAPKLRKAFEEATKVAEAGGTAIVQGDGRKNYKLNSGTKGGAVRVPPNLKGRLEFHGEGCTFTFTSNVRHLFDCVESTKHDVICNFLAQDFTIDAANAHKAGVREHIVFGNQIEGTIQKYLQFEDITLQRWKVVNAFSFAEGEAETALTGVFIRLKQLGTLQGGEEPDLARNIVVREWRMEGGLVGVDIGGESSTKVTETIEKEGKPEEVEHSDLANVTIDDVYIEDWYHSVGKESGGKLHSSSIQIGHYCIGGTFTVRNGFSEYAGDVGVEIDFVEKCLVENVTVKDPKNSCFLSPGMGKPLRGVGLQYFVNCRAIRLREIGNCVGYLQEEGSGTSGNGAPQVYYENCSFFANRPQIAAPDQAWFFKGATEFVSLTNCRAEIVGLKGFTGPKEPEAPIVVLGTTVNTTLRIRGLDLLVAGKDESALLKPVFLQLSGTSGTTRVVDVRGVTIRDGLERGGKRPRYVKVGVGTTPVTFRGSLEFTVLADGAAEEATAITFYPGTKVNGRLNVTADTKAMRAPSLTLSLQSGFEGQSSVRFVNSNPKESLAKAAISVEGTSSFTYTNLDPYPELVTVRGGTVSKIELNGADVGVTAGAFPVNLGDKLAVTFSSKPTMEKLPTP